MSLKINFSFSHLYPRTSFKCSILIYGPNAFSICKAVIAHCQLIDPNFILHLHSIGISMAARKQHAFGNCSILILDPKCLRHFYCRICWFEGLLQNKKKIMYSPLSYFFFCNCKRKKNSKLNSCMNKMVFVSFYI